MYINDDRSLDFYMWVFPKCDHIAMDTGMVWVKQDIKVYQWGIKERVKPKINSGKVIKVEANPISKHLHLVQVRGYMVLVRDVTKYVTKCSGEGIYFVAKLGCICKNFVIKASEGGERMINKCGDNCGLILLVCKLSYYYVIDKYNKS
ncbi:Geranylgeranyl diphosphate reductase [Spatholobus suberectus]|nr:Geranylgeranyl diphosphate reductase [Spatholobus suberectus]